MDRRAFMVGGVAALPTPVAAEAQQASKVYRIGYLSSRGCPIRPETIGPLRQGLRELGYAEGQNITIECRGGAPGVADRFTGFAAELVRLKVDVLVAKGTASALAAKQATKTIPIRDECGWRSRRKRARDALGATWRQRHGPVCPQ
jgi:putative tryptophan/tyrosine transport system substrate-binding protein